MPGFVPSEVKTYQYAANIVYDELIDKYGAEKVNKVVNINKIKQAVEKGKARGLKPHEVAERLYKGIDTHMSGVGKKAAQKPMWKAQEELAAKAAKIKNSGNYFKSSASSETKAATQKVASKLSKYGRITGGLALATLAIYASYQVYKNYLSAAARACTGKTTKEKLECMKKFRMNARREQIKKLKESLKDCIKTKNSLACKKAILLKIQKINKRIK